MRYISNELWWTEIKSEQLQPFNETQDFKLNIYLKKINTQKFIKIRDLPKVLVCLDCSYLGNL